VRVGTVDDVHGRGANTTFRLQASNTCPSSFLAASRQPIPNRSATD